MDDFKKSGVEDVQFSPPGYTEIMEEEEVRRQNLELLIEIAKLCNRRDRKHVENIFLLGKPGAGKSALINTVIKVLAGKYIPKAAVGAGVRQSKTLTLESYKSCGVTRDDIDDPNQRDLVVGILRKLPTILDAAGRDDPETYDNPEAIEEILELFIGGFISPGTSIDALEALQREHNVGCLRDVFYTESKPEWKVTKVVFVQSCRDTVPVGLIQCLDKILRKTDPKTAQPKYTGDVFVVITKYDLVSDQTQFQNNSDPRRETISMEDFQKLENTIAKQFSIKGSQDHNMIRWVSYADRVSFDNPYIDNIALKFIKRMLQPGNKPAESTPIPVITQEKIMKMKAKKMWKECNLSVTHVILAVLMICVAILMFKLLSAGPGRTF